MKAPKCPKCGRDATESQMRVEESIVRSSDNSILATQRNFDGICPEHGLFWNGLIGNHSTQLENSLRKRIPKHQWKRLRSKLPASERKNFKRAINGKWFPSEQIIEERLTLLE